MKVLIAEKLLHFPYWYQRLIKNAVLVVSVN